MPCTISIKINVYSILILSREIQVYPLICPYSGQKGFIFGYNLELNQLPPDIHGRGLEVIDTYRPRPFENW